MKILFPFYPLHSGVFPAEKVKDGVVASSEIQIQALLSQGHEVTLLTTEDFVVNDSRVTHKTFPALSKEKAGKTPWSKMLAAILHHQRTEDVVILNMAEFQFKKEEVREAFKEFIHKVRVIYHHYDERAFSSYFVTHYQFLSWVQQEGGRSFSVSCLFDKYSKAMFEKKPDIISGNPFHNPDLPTRYTEMGWLNTVLGSKPTMPLQEDPDNSFLLIGRASPEKRLLTGVKAFKEAKVDGKLHVFTVNSNVKSHQTYFHDLVAACEHPDVVLHLEEPRKNVLEQLAKTSTVIFPSMNEACPLVPMEALSHGCNFLYWCKHTFFATEWGVRVEKSTPKCFAEAIRASRPKSAAERQFRSDNFCSMYSFKEFTERYCFSLLKG